MTKTLKAELWIKLTLPGVGQIGPGKIQLLRNIREHQSITAAAREMGMSYRRAWLLVDEMNRLFAQPLVAKWQGGRSKGGASLTRLGEELIRQYEAVVERSAGANEDLLKDIGRKVCRTKSSRRG
jgi:molybdate transport system regulatory protein